MTLIIPDGYGHVIHSMSLTGDAERIAITYGVSFETSGTDTHQEAVDALRLAFVTELGGTIATGYQHVQTELIVGAALQTDHAIYLNTNPATFTGTNAPLPQNCALLAHKRSAQSGRRHRGRFYVPGINEAEVNQAGVCSTALLNLYSARLTAFLTGVRNSAKIADMVILHTLTGVGSVPAPTVVTSLIPDTVIATQRRRLRK